MKKAIAVAFVVVSSICLVAQTSEPKIPKTCSEQNTLRDDKIVWFTPEQMKARATKMVTPKMPALWRQARIEGEVVVGIVVAKDGKPDCVWMISGHPMLVSSAIQAAGQWEFKPHLSKGKPVAFAGTLRFKVTNYQFTY